VQIDKAPKGLVREVRWAGEARRSRSRRRVAGIGPHLGPGIARLGKLRFLPVDADRHSARVRHAYRPTWTRGGDLRAGTVRPDVDRQPARMGADRCGLVRQVDAAIAVVDDPELTAGVCIWLSLPAGFIWQGSSSSASLEGRGGRGGVPPGEGCAGRRAAPLPAHRQRQGIGPANMGCCCQVFIDWLSSMRWPSGSRRKQRISAPQSCGGVRKAPPRASRVW